ncbi:MAG: sulfite exporter TauE/SafE family protein [Alphaproteobacteria bacterium]|nr:sulfite exporter TauE/SafE family protein [Alphaproteobacteria bacterium]
MDTLDTVLLATAGFCGGILTALAGGSGLITFPALIATGLPPLIANASNNVALTLSNLAAALADRQSWPRFDRRIAALFASAGIGSAAGVWLLLRTSARTFEVLVPALIILATAIFAAGPRLRLWAARSGAHRGLAASTIPVVGLLSVYGGYFGSGLGVMLLAWFAVAETEDFRRANALKNLCGAAMNVVAFALLAMTPLISWPETLTLLASSVCGGFAGGRLARVLPPRAVRLVVIAIGTIMSLVFMRRYWLR